MSSRTRTSGRTQSAAATAATALPSRPRAPSAAEVRSRYVKRLDDTVDKMIESFKSVISASQIQDRASNARCEYQAQVGAANLALAAESLVRLISELKSAMIVQDIGESTQDERSAIGALGADTRRANDELIRLLDSVSTNLSSLEQHYYSSVPHARAHQAAASANTAARQPPQ